MIDVTMGKERITEIVCHLTGSKFGPKFEIWMSNVRGDEISFLVKKRQHLRGFSPMHAKSGGDQFTSSQYGQISNCHEMESILREHELVQQHVHQTWRAYQKTQGGAGNLAGLGQK